MPLPVASYLAAQVIRFLPRETISRGVGRLCDAPLSPAVSRVLVKAYARAYRCDLSEVCAPDQPYASFDEFFTRKLVDGCRPVSPLLDDVVSPADGTLQCVGRVEDGCRILVKGRPYDVARLVGDEAEARSYIGGQFAVVYLSPRDYHRVHAPVDGTVHTIRSMPGDLYPVNSIGERWVRDLFVVNRRVALVFDTAALGPVTMVMVGAMVVGRITVNAIDARDVPLGNHVLQPPVSYRKGEEVGAFHLGSTAVLLAGAQAPSWQRRAGLIRVGQSLARNG